MKAYCLVLFNLLFLSSIATFAQSPLITSFNPASGPAGTIVTIDGNAFNFNAEQNAVYFGGVKAAVESASTGRLKVIVPVGATYEPITVINKAAGKSYTSRLPFNVTYSTNLQTPPPSTIALKHTSLISALADISDDGMLDLVTISFNDGLVSVYKNNASPGARQVTFASPVDVSVQSTPSSIKVVDVDGDGRLDIVVGRSYNQKVSVLRNTSVNGNISFAAMIEYTFLPNPVGSVDDVDVADIDGDGKPDMAITQSTRLIFMRNTSSLSNISFSAPVYVQLDNTYQHLKLADIDGDGRRDLITFNNGDNQLYVARNMANFGTITASSFATPQSFLSGINSKFTLADLDGDGKLDFVSRNVIARNTSTPGNMSFDAQKTYPNTAVGDVDGDGKPDLVFDDEYLTVKKNVSVGSDISFVSKKFPISAQSNIVASSVLGDVNGDGKLDLLTGARLLLNDPPQPQVPVITGFSPLNGSVGSVVTITGKNFGSIPGSNIVKFGSARAEITSASATELKVKLPKGATFEPFSILNTTSHSIGFSKKPFSITYAKSRADVLRADFEAPVEIETIGTATALGFGDLNNDGKPDMVMRDNRGLAMFINNSSAGNIDPSLFTHVYLPPAGIEPTIMKVFDIDNDGRPDIIMSGSSYQAKQAICIYRNTGTATAPSFLSSPISYDIGDQGTRDFGRSPVALYFVDVDGDGRADIVAGGGVPAGQACILQNRTSPGTVNSASFNLVKINVRPNGLLGGGFFKMADLDEDGKPDFITTFLNDRSVNISTTATISYNRSVPGAVLFESDILPISPGPNGLSMGDVNNDGKIDFFVSTNGAKLSVFFNTSVQGNATFSSYSINQGIQGSLINFDINGDGKQDLYNISGTAYTNKYSSGVITVNSFKQQTIHDNPFADVNFVDIDGDGKADLAGRNNTGIVFMRYEPQFASLAGIKDNLNVMQALSPNADGINDVLTIEGIENFPDNKVTILSSLGAQIYETSGYNNTSKAFNGTSVTGARQQNGLYYYHIEYTDAGVKKNKSGYLVLKN